MTIPTYRPMPPEPKRDYNKQLFKVVAPRYDLVTRVMSFNRDVSWKRRLIADLPEQDYRLCLDLACGTGDLTFAVARRFPRATVFGIDVTPTMIELATQKNLLERIHFVEGDMNALAWDAASVDLVTAGYALRNAPDLIVALGEIHRVLKPGGVAAFLDFSRPGPGLTQRFQHGLLKWWGCLWGLAFHLNPAVYGYIAESLAAFPDRDRLHGLLRETGFEILQSRRSMLGIIEMTICRRSN